MVVYYCYIPTSLTTMVLHRISCRSDKSAVLLIKEGDMGYIKENIPHIERFVENGFFNKIISSKNKKFNWIKTEEEIVSVLTLYWDEFFDRNNINVKETEFIISADCENDLGLYLSLVNKTYWFLEISKNELAIFGNIRYNSVTPKEGGYADLAKKYRAFDADCIHSFPIIRADSDRTMKLYEKTDNIQVFNIETIIANLNDEQYDKILASYDFMFIKPDSDYNAIVFLQSLGTAIRQLTVLSPNYIKAIGDYGKDYNGIQGYFTSLAIDYFLGDFKNIYFKPHPNGVITDDIKAKYTTNAKYISNTFPVDLLGMHKVFKDFKFDVSLGFGGGSSNYIAAVANKQFGLSAYYWGVSWKYHSIYTAVRIIGKLNSVFETIYCTQPILEAVRNLQTHYNKRQLNILNCDYRNKDFDNDSIYVISDFEKMNNLVDRLSAITKNVLLFFIDRNECFEKIISLLGENKKFCFRFVLIKDIHEDNRYELPENDYLYIFCKNSRILDFLFHVSFNWSLAHTGVSINAKFDLPHFMLNLSASLYDDVNRILKDNCKKITTIEKIITILENEIDGNFNIS